MLVNRFSHYPVILDSSPPEIFPLILRRTSTISYTLIDTVEEGGDDLVGNRVRDLLGNSVRMTDDMDDQLSVSL